MSLFNDDISDPIPSKTCPYCSERKALEQFYIDKRRPGCRSTRCKECVAKVAGQLRVQTKFRINKRCTVCHETKPIDCFAKRSRSRDGHYSCCKDCGTQRRVQGYRERAYNLSPAQYSAMFLSQGGKCLICGRNDTGSRRAKSMYVDHCHSTGKVRGLLCSKCNSVLGYVCDSVEILQKAIDYLNAFK